MIGFSATKSVLAELTEIGLLLVSLGVTIQILFGTGNIPFVGDVVGNLTALVASLGEQGLVGLIAIAVILHLFNKRSS